uniref:CRM domain-containing protein n=1 Tax=Kalanchoe fedtschenkoi TaxID=63787 RepID=A0A7N0TJ23_KALFE
MGSSPLANFFSSLPPPQPSSSSPASALPPTTPIPIPKYPPPRRHRKPLTADDDENGDNPKSAFRATHRRTKYYKPVKAGVISSDGDRSVLVGESGVSYLLPGAPFHFQYSYSETPKTKPLAIREPAFLPFATPTMSRPWTGKAPLKKKKDKPIRLFHSQQLLDGENEYVDVTTTRRLETVRAIELGTYANMKPRKDVLGEPLRKWEIKMLIKPYLTTNKQVNLGRDGLTHNMLELVHSHWRRQEKKTGGKIIHRIGGVVYLFRGRNYDHHTRPQFPVMLWKPAAPVYPKLIQEAPEGLTAKEADELRMKGKRLLPICRLAKNGVYISLVKDVRYAFEGCPLVKIDCTGMHATDYKKLGAKLKDLVPCTLLSFDDEQILMWRGHDWKSMYPSRVTATKEMSNSNDSGFRKNTGSTKASSKMVLLLKRAIASNRAFLLDELNLDPDELLKKVELFEGISQTPEHSYPALLVNESNYIKSGGEFGSGDLNEEFGQESLNNRDDYDTDLVESYVPLGSLPIDHLAERLTWNH